VGWSIADQFYAMLKIVPKCSRSLATSPGKSESILRLDRSAARQKTVNSEGKPHIDCNLHAGTHAELKKRIIAAEKPGRIYTVCLDDLKVYCWRMPSYVVHMLSPKQNAPGHWSKATSSELYSFTRVTIKK
jgi:hypothetical protein